MAPQLGTLQVSNVGFRVYGCTQVFQLQYPVCAVLESLRLGLREAEVLELGPGAPFLQRSHVVLLRGSLRASGRTNSVPASAQSGTLRSTLFNP